MPKQNYEQFMEGEYAGQLFGMATSSSVITSRRAGGTNPIRAGVAGNYDSAGVFTAGATGGVVGGIVLRQQINEANARPASATAALAYPVGQAIPVAERALVVVEYAGSTPITSKEIFVSETLGTWHQAAVAGIVRATNVKVIRTLPPKPGYTQLRAVVEIS